MTRKTILQYFIMIFMATVTSQVTFCADRNDEDNVQQQIMYAPNDESADENNLNNAVIYDADEIADMLDDTDDDTISTYILSDNEDDMSSIHSLSDDEDDMNSVHPLTDNEDDSDE